MIAWRIGGIRVTLTGPRLDRKTVLRDLKGGLELGKDGGES